MKKFWLQMMIICFLLLLPINVYGETQAPLTMEVTYGFQGIVKSGNCFPLRLKLTSHQESKEYTIEIQVPAEAVSDSISTSIWMNGESWNNNSDRVTTYKKTVTLQKGETKEEIFYLNLPVLESVINIYVKDGSKTVAQEEINCIFTDNTYRILTGVITQNTEGLENLDGMHVAMDEYYGSDTFVKIIQLEPYELYTNPDALSQLDVLIVESGTEFSEEQTAALGEWNENGGFILEQQGEALDVCFQQLLQGEEKDSFLDYLHSMTMYFHSGTTELDLIPVSEKPELMKYLVILLIYILLVGPGFHYYLKRKNKQKHIWTCICGTSVIAFVFIAVLGMGTRVSAPYICYHTLYEQREEALKETIEFSIQAPYNSSYHMYVDNSYEITTLQENTYGTNAVKNALAENITITYGEEKNQITIDNVATFTPNAFSLKRKQEMSRENQIQVQLQVKEDGKTLFGGWTNPTSFTIKNALLVLPNQVAVLGKLKANTATQNQEYVLSSYGNSGMDLFIEEQLDFSDFQYQAYEASNLSEQVWSTLYNSKTNQAYVIGIVENDEASFQENTGYKAYGSALMRIPVDINWESNGSYWCPNLKIHSESLDGNYNAETNLINGTQATVDYSVQSFVSVEKMEFYQMDYDDTRFFYPFKGKIAVYNWMTGEFQEIQDWKTMLQGGDVISYISSTGVIRIRYLLDDTNYDANRSCMLPCIRLCGKVREYAAN